MLDGRCVVGDLVYLRDLDGTGSMHVCAQGDSGAVEYIPADLRHLLIGALEKIADEENGECAHCVACAALKQSQGE